MTGLPRSGIRCLILSTTLALSLMGLAAADPSSAVRSDSRPSPLVSFSARRPAAPPVEAVRFNWASKAIALMQRDCGEQDANDNPFADVAWSRDLSVLQLSMADRNTLGAVYLSQDPKIAADLLHNWRESESSDRRYVALITRAFITIKSSPSFPGEEVTSILDTTEPLLASVGIPVSDYHYLRAVTLLESGRPQEGLAAVERALAAEPRFFSALVLKFILLHDRLTQSGLRDGAQCQTQIGTLMETVISLADLSVCRHSPALVMEFLRRRNPDLDSGPLATLVTAAFAFLARNPVSLQVSRARFSQEDAGWAIDCRRSLMNELTSLEGMIRQ